jgi:hypothetical protein
LVGFAADRHPPPPRETEVRTQLAIAAVLIGATLLIIFVAGYSLGSNRSEQPGSLELGPIEELPSEDVPGEEVAGLRRYPGAVRVKYESHLLGDQQVSEAGYLVEKGSEFEVGRYYGQRLAEEGWSLEGEDFDAGELVLGARRSEEELLVELEDRGELVEIEMELHESLSP